MMNHEMIEARLDDFVDGLLSEDEQYVVQGHLNGCEACRAEVQTIRELQTAAHALPRQIAPPRDLWAGIAARIEQEREAEQPAEPESEERVKVIRVDFGQRSRPAWWMGRGMLAAAAILLMIVSSSVTALLMRSGPAAPGAPIAGTVMAPSQPGQPNSALVAFEPAEQVMVETVEQLEFALEAQRDQLSPATVAVVEENLRIIDHAIREARAALEADPNNRDLTFLLMDVYKKKVDLLQNAVQISSL
jgi:anti-sigma factor RsiW